MMVLLIAQLLAEPCHIPGNLLGCLLGHFQLIQCLVQFGLNKKTRLMQFASTGNNLCYLEVILNLPTGCIQLRIVGLNTFKSYCQR